MAYAPTVNVTPGSATTPPRVEVVFESLNPDATSLAAIHRLADRRDWRVRGSINMSVSDQTARIDPEVPFGIPVTYRGEMLDGSTALGFTDGSSPVTVSSDYTWVHNPLDPQTVVRVNLEKRTSHEWSRPVAGDTVFPAGRRVGVVVGGDRSGLRGQEFWLWVDSEAEADRFAALVGDYSVTTVPVLCIRLADNIRMRIPRPLFASVLDPREIDINLSIGMDKVGFSFRSDEVAPPTPALVIPLLTRADLNAYYATRAALNADNLTRLSANRRYDLAGVADA